MPLLLADAQLLSNNDLIRGVVEEIVDIDETFALLPFVKTDGKAYVYNREGTLATASFQLPNIDVAEDATSFTEVTVSLKILIGDVDVDNFLNSTMSDTNAQKAVQVAHKAKAIARKFSDTFVNGSTATTYDFSTRGGASGTSSVDFDGLVRLSTATGKVITNGANGGALTFDLIDEALDLVKLGADCIVMSRRTVRQYKAMLRALNTVVPEYITLSNGKNVMSYANLPILMNEFIPEDVTVGTSTDCTYVFAARFNEVDGVHGVYGGDNLGFAITEIGQLEKRDATRTRVKWYVTVALKSTLSLARVDGVH